MSVLDKMELGFRTRYALTAIDVAIASCTASLLYHGLAGRQWWIILIACGMSWVFLPSLVVDLWGSYKQLKLVGIVAKEKAYGFAGPESEQTAIASLKRSSGPTQKKLH
jgi:hypothetical protein